MAAHTDEGNIPMQLAGGALHLFVQVRIYLFLPYLNVNLNTDRELNFDVHVNVESLHRKPPQSAASSTVISSATCWRRRSYS